MTEDIVGKFLLFRWVKFVFHLASLLCLTYALWGFSKYNTETTFQQTVIALWQIKFILMAILFEVGAFNSK